MARPLRGGSGRSSKGGGAENGAPVAKRRAKRIESFQGSVVCGQGGWRESFRRESFWADQVAGLGEFARGVSRESCSLGGCGERELFSGTVERVTELHGGESARESRGERSRVLERRGSEPRATRTSDACTCRHELRAPRRRDSRGVVAQRDDAPREVATLIFFSLGSV